MNDENEKFYIESLGLEIRLRPYSLDDYFRLTKDEDIPLPEKARVKKILYDHMISPPVEFEEFEEISDINLEDLGSKFLNNNFDSELEYSDGEDFYHFFLRVISNEENKFRKNLQNTVSPILQSNIKFVNNLMKTIEPLLKSSIILRQPQIDLIVDIQREWIANIAQSIILPNLDIISSLESFSTLISSLNQHVTESVQHQVNYLIDWFDSHDAIFAPFRQYWQSFEEEYKITEERAVEILSKYHWFFSPSMPFSLLDKIVKVDEKGGSNLHREINYLFYEYFKENHRSNLQNMVNSWEDIPLFSGKRFKIITDCVDVIMFCDSTGNNAANVVVPTLITLIEGIMCDYLEMHGLSWNLNEYGWIDLKTHDLLKDKNGNKLKPKDIIKDLKPKTMPSLLDDLASELAFDILFQRAYRGAVPEKEILFSRHKIMHGENIYYGRKDYMIKVLIILDFLAHIIDQT